MGFFAGRRTAAILEPDKKEWVPIDLYWRKKFPFKGEVISSYYHPGNHALYFGTAGSGVYAFYLQTKQWRHLKGTDIARYWIKAFAAKDSILCIASEQQLHLYLRSKQIRKIDLKDYHHLPKGAIVNKIWWPEPDKLWILFNRAGLAQISLQNAEVIDWIKPRDREEQNFYDVAFSSKGTFIGTAGGLLCYSDGGKRVLWGASYQLSSIRDLCFYKDALWFSEGNQLWQWSDPEPAAMG